MNINIKSYFNVMSILMMIFGVLLCISVVGLIFGIPAILGAQEFSRAEKYNTKQLKEKNTTLLVWGVLFGACTTPIGIVAIVFAILVNEQISAMKEEKKVVVEDPKENTTKEQETTNVDIKSTTESLERLRANGVITEEEYQEKLKSLNS